ncbi:hypothetical protein DFH06DRAFT_1436337 [Mycena polygramma]|nr:hypothetical protein DFH06DRAFT_1436337 [Mycena polygramma]
MPALPLASGSATLPSASTTNDASDRNTSNLTSPGCPATFTINTVQEIEAQLEKVTCCSYHEFTLCLSKIKLLRQCFDFFPPDYLFRSQLSSQLVDITELALMTYYARLCPDTTSGLATAFPFLTETVSAVDQYVESQSDFVLQSMLSSKGQHISLCDSDANYTFPPATATLLGWSSPLEISIASCSTSLASTTEPQLENCTAQGILNPTPCLPVGDKSSSAFPDFGSAPPILRESTNLPLADASIDDWTFLFNKHDFIISETAHTSSLEQPNFCQGDLTDEALLLLSPNTILSSLLDMQAEDVDDYLLSEALDLDLSEGSNFGFVEGSSSPYSLTPSTSRSSSDSLASSGCVPSLPGTPAETAAGGQSIPTSGSADPHISLFSSPTVPLIWSRPSYPHDERNQLVLESNQPGNESAPKVNWSAREREQRADEKSIKVRKYYRERKKVQLDTTIGEWIHLGN